MIAIDRPRDPVVDRVSVVPQDVLLEPISFAVSGTVLRRSLLGSMNQGSYFRSVLYQEVFSPVAISKIVSSISEIAISHVGGILH